MDVHKKQNFIVSDNTSTRWVKPAPPTEPIFLIPTLLMRGPNFFMQVMLSSAGQLSLSSKVSHCKLNHESMKWSLVILCK